MAISRKNRLNDGTGTFEVKYQGPEEAERVFEQVILGVGSEYLTDDLIKELVGRGFPGPDLKRLQKSGFRYCRSRNSFIGGR